LTHIIDRELNYRSPGPTVNRPKAAFFGIKSIPVEGLAGRGRRRAFGLFFLRGPQ
jgi:hypothetical protein